MRVKSWRRAFTALATAAVAVGVVAETASPAGAAPTSGRPPGVLVSSHGGADSSSCGLSARPCATIDQGVANASVGGTVTVLPGMYSGNVTITKQVQLRGINATIDASGADQGVWLRGGGASGSSVQGFTVQNAIGEGILLTAVDNVTIAGNHVTANDNGAHSASAYPPCADNGPIPGDCGEAVHLQGTTNSHIVWNLVDHNIGGILVTDEAGPTSGNLIAGNTVRDNAEDCGITMPSHVPGLGVTHNTVMNNDVENNGGAGVLIATPAPGTFVTNNVVTGNVIVGNGEGGVQLHSHAPAQSIDNNTITNNYIGTNNTAGDSDSGDMQTTGVIVFSGFVHVNGLVIQDNTIANNQIGIWLTPTLVDASGVSNNTFVNVATNVQQ